MKLEEVPTPEPGPGEVLIEVAAVSVNRTLDCIVRSGKYPRPVKLPHILGVDPVGTVVATGAGVTDRKIGDRVAMTLHLSKPGEPLNLIGIDCWGGYAKYLKLPVRNTYRLPEKLDFHTACVVARHAPLAHNMLRNKVKLQSGEWVLVMGAAGGLASFIVQIAKHLGAHVIAAAGTDHHVEVALGLGADHGINYRKQDLTVEVQKLTGGKGAQVVCENIGDPELFPKAFAALAMRGRVGHRRRPRRRCRAAAYLQSLCQEHDHLRQHRTDDRGHGREPQSRGRWSSEGADRPGPAAIGSGARASDD